MEWLKSFIGSLNTDIKKKEMEMKKIIVVLLSCLLAVTAFAEPPEIPNGNLYYCGGNYELVKRAVIDDAVSGDNTLVAAVTDRKIRVLNYTLVTAGAVNIRFESAASGTALTGQMEFDANSGASVDCFPSGCFETAAGALLNMELSGAVSVDGHLTYVECE